MLITTATELPRLMVCIGSRNMPAALPPDHDHEARDEGNAAHWLAKEAFEGRAVVPGQKAYNGYVITEEMMDHVKTYLDALDLGQMEIETTFAGANWEVRGRADHIVSRVNIAMGECLIVDDFKYGYRLVEPMNNWTLLAHAIGWCIRYQATPAAIILRIHQPRPYHPDGPTRQWMLSYGELMSYYAEINERLSNPTDELRSRLDVCAKCHAHPTCPAARQAGYNAIDATSLAFSDTLPDDVLANELTTLNYAMATIKNRAEALDELMTHKIKNGAVIPGYALKTRYAQTRWKTGMSGEALSAATGRKLTKDSIVTPAEAKRRGVPEAVVAALTERPSIGTKLERIDADQVARKIFGAPQS